MSELDNQLKEIVRQCQALLPDVFKWKGFSEYHFNTDGADIVFQRKYNNGSGQFEWTLKHAKWVEKPKKRRSRKEKDDAQYSEN